MYIRYRRTDVKREVFYFLPQRPHAPAPLKEAADAQSLSKTGTGNLSQTRTGTGHLLIQQHPGPGVK
jgi:hypothetical protein